MQDFKTEVILTTGLCSERTAKTIFGEQADYYQSLHAIYKILSEAICQYRWLDNERDLEWEIGTNRIMQRIVESKAKGSKLKQLREEAHPHLSVIQNALNEYIALLESKTIAKFWLFFLEPPTFYRFLFYQCEADW